MSHRIASIAAALLVGFSGISPAAADPTASDLLTSPRIAPLSDLHATRAPDPQHHTADVFAINAMLGMGVTGLRLELFPFSTGIFKLGVEFAGGLAVAGAGVAPGVDFGLRAHLRVLTGNRDALYVSPGVSALLVFGDEHLTSAATWGGGTTTEPACRSGWFTPPCTTVPYLVPDLDLSWVHYTSERTSFELGLFGGYGPALGGSTARGSAEGTFTLRAGLFIGFRG